MTDSEKIDAIFRYIQSQPDCPQNLWSDERRAYEAARQAAFLGIPVERLQAAKPGEVIPWSGKPNPID